MYQKWATASMRPELIRSGNSGFQGRAHAGLLSFNEAGANSLRKYTRTAPMIDPDKLLQ